MNYNKEHLFCNDLPTIPKPEKGKILVTGATGYIGGLLIPELVARGYDVRVMVRTKNKEMHKKWDGVEIVVADARDPNQLRVALDKIQTAYYLIHSLMLGQSKFELADIEIAQNFRKISEEKGIKRIIYLSGLGNSNTKLSQHLTSRMEVATELSKGSVAVTTLRSAIVVGSGSASFKIIMQVVKNSPIILLPPWAKTKCQPIGIKNVIKYLVGIMEYTGSTSKYHDIGGKDVLSYEEMIKIMVDVLGKKRIFLNVPFSNTSLFGNLTSLFTNVQPSITKCLIEGCKNEVVCCNNNIATILNLKPLSYREAVEQAVAKKDIN
ncbi:MAG: NmrA family NAD(P)-binding protein [Bacteroidales bacterium]